MAEANGGEGQAQPKARGRTARDLTRDEIDALIGEAAEHWRVGRMTLVDRNILRLGAYELSLRSDIPFAVAINEAVELGKRFGAEESGAFINGILDRISEIVRKKSMGEGSA